MKSSFVLIALFALLMVVTTASAQSNGNLQITQFYYGAAQPGFETVKATFTAPGGGQFVIKEAFFRTGTEEECVSTRDFSRAVLVSSDRASMVFDPAIGVWYLRNTNTPAPAWSNCRVLILDDGTAEGNDFLLWQRNFGSAGLADTESATKDGSGEEAQRSMVRSVTVTFSTSVTL